MYAVSGNSRGGSRKTSMKRKYLGDPEDPHFVPESPILSRQSITFAEEEELTRSCTLVLSSVQHADDEEEDPLMKYVTHAITTKPKVLPKREKSTFSKSSVGTSSDFGSTSQRPRRINGDSATPSETSKRNTIDRTDTSTPLTILSETQRRSSSTRQRVALRSDSKASRKHTALGFSDEPDSDDLPKSIAATKSMISLRISEARRHQAGTAAGKLGTLSISHVEFNKSLPTLPRCEAPVSATEKHPGSLSRFFQSMKKRSADPSGAETSFRKSFEVHKAPNVSVVQMSKKHKFSFASLFDRRRKQQFSMTEIS